MRKLFFTLTLMICLIMSPVVTSAATIIVDAGHGGEDPGAIGVTGLREKEVNLDIAQKLEAELIANGHQVFMIREDDDYISLEDRIKIAREQSADLFISIHANSFPNEEPHGALILYYDDARPQKNYPASKEMKQLTPQSKQLATDVLDQFITQTGLYNRGIVPSSVYVVRMGNVPSILIETAFLSNKGDEQKLKEDTMRETMAKSIADGIEQYLQHHNPFVDVRDHWALQHIMKLHEQGIIVGTSANKFAPERPLTRAEWMTMLERIIPATTEVQEEDQVEQEVYEEFVEQNELVEQDEVGEQDESAEQAEQNESVEQQSDLSTDRDIFTEESEEKAALPFSDINEEHWAYVTLQNLYNEGLIDGFPDGTLRPDAQITRAEVSSMLKRIIPVELDPVAVSDYQMFSDVTEKHWAFSAIHLLKQRNVIVGDKQGMFYPDQAITRAEISAVVDRYLEQF